MDKNAFLTKERNCKSDPENSLDVREHTVALHKSSAEYLKDKDAMDQLRAFRDYRKKAIGS